MRLIFKLFVKCSRYIQRIDRIPTKCYASVTNNYVNQLKEETLTNRLFVYLKRDESNSMKRHKIEKMLKILKYKDQDNLRKCNINQVMCGMNLAINSDLPRNERDLIYLLNMIDTEYCRRLNELETSTIFEILQTYLNTIPNRILEYDFYYLAIDKIFSNIDSLSKNDIIKLIFYIGLQKKAIKSQFKLKKCVKILNNESILNSLTIEELSIVCNSTFKTSTKIYYNAFLDKIINYLNDNLNLLNDTAIFVCLVKTLVHNRYQNEDLMTTISSTIFFNNTLQYYSFAAMSHILALYSDFLYYDENLIETFTKKCIQQLKDSNDATNSFDQPRLKHIQKLLCCLSYLNYKNLEGDVIKNVIVPYIQKRLEAGDFKHDYSEVIEIMLHLWMLNYRAYELVPYAFLKETIQFIKVSNSNTNLRLNELLSCIYFEDRKLFKEINIYPQDLSYNLQPQLKKRPLLQKIIDVLKHTTPDHEINKFEMANQIPCMKIIGITGFRKKIYKAVHIEVLDNFTTLKNTDNVPTGPMQLKLRIMDGFEEGLIVIQADEIESMSDEELQSFLLDEIKLVC